METAEKHLKTLFVSLSQTNDVGENLSRFKNTDCVKRSILVPKNIFFCAYRTEK